MEIRGLGTVQRNYHRCDANRPARCGPIRGDGLGTVQRTITAATQIDPLGAGRSGEGMREERCPRFQCCLKRAMSNADRTRFGRAHGVLDTVKVSVGARDAFVKALPSLPLGHPDRPRDRQPNHAQPLQYGVGAPG